MGTWESELTWRQVLADQKEGGSEITDTFYDEHKDPAVIAAGGEGTEDEEELERERLRVDDPVKTFEVVSEIAASLREAIHEVNDPWDFYPRLMGMVSELQEKQELPEQVRTLIAKLVDGVKDDIRRIAKEREMPNDADSDLVCQAVVDDVKAISHVALNKDVIEKIEYTSISVDSIEGLSEILPQLKQLTKHTAIKGGLGRLALKLYALQCIESDSDAAGILIETIPAELPFSDVDLMMTKEETDPRAVAKTMGAKPVDIEMINSFSHPMLIDYFGRRDLSSNQVLLMRDKLIFTEQALDDMMHNPGEAQSAVSSIAGLFGRETFYAKRRAYQSSNTLYRRIKMVSEGKDTHCTVRKYNVDAIKMWKYWNTLIRKWMRRDNGAEIFARAFSCAKQIGETETDTPAKFLRELIDNAPDFDYKSEQSELEVTQWIMGKYVTFMQKILNRTFGLRSSTRNEVFESTDETEIVVRPNVDGVTPEQLDEVRAIFKELCGEDEAVGERVVTAENDDSNDEILLKILDKVKTKRQEIIAEKKRREEEVKKQIETMRENGPQERDSLAFSHSHYSWKNILLVTNDYVYITGSQHRHRQKIAVSDIELKYIKQLNEIVWMVKKGAKSNWVTGDEKRRLWPNENFTKSSWERDPWDRW